MQKSLPLQIPTKLVWNALENALQERVDGYKANSFTRALGEYEFMEMLNHEDLDIVQEKNRVDCDSRIEKEGYSRQDVLALIDECTFKQMY